MTKKIFQVMILCGLTASMNEAMAKAAVGKDATNCDVACNALVMYWESKLTDFEVESTKKQIHKIYHACIKNCKNPKK